MIITWNAGTPMASRKDANGNALPAAQYVIDGTLAGRIGKDLTDAIAAEVGFDPSKVVVSGTDVVVDGQALMTLADGYIDNPMNNRVARELRRLVMNHKGDRKTVFRMALRAIVRVLKFRLSLTKAQTTALVGQVYDTVTSADTDG